MNDCWKCSRIGTGDVTCHLCGGPFEAVERHALGHRHVCRKCAGKSSAGDARLADAIRRAELAAN